MNYDDDRLYSIKQAAELLDVNYPFLLRKVNMGKVQAIRQDVNYKVKLKWVNDFFEAESKKNLKKRKAIVV